MEEFKASLRREWILVQRTIFIYVSYAASAHTNCQILSDQLALQQCQCSCSNAAKLSHQISAIEVLGTKGFLACRLWRLHSKPPSLSSDSRWHHSPVSIWKATCVLWEKNLQGNLYCVTIESASRVYVYYISMGTDISPDYTHGLHRSLSKGRQASTTNLWQGLHHESNLSHTLPANPTTPQIPRGWHQICIFHLLHTHHHAVRPSDLNLISVIWG